MARRGRRGRPATGARRVVDGAGADEDDRADADGGQPARAVTGVAMSFRRFVWYCAVCGAWSALVGWGLGVLVAPAGGTPTDDLIRAALLGLSLGLCVACGLGLLDAVWNLSLRQFGQVVLRVGAALVI